MPEFTVRYWFGDDTVGGDTIPYISEGLMAQSVDDAARILQERMNLPFFAVDSDGYGRALINRDNIRFCSILPAQTAEEAAEQARAQAVVQEFSTRMADAYTVVDNDTRRF